MPFKINQPWWMREDMAGDGGANGGGLGGGGRQRGGMEHDKAHSIKRSQWGDKMMMKMLAHPKI